MLCPSVFNSQDKDHFYRNDVNKNEILPMYVKINNTMITILVIIFLTLSVEWIGRTIFSFMTKPKTKPVDNKETDIDCDTYKHYIDLHVQPYKWLDMRPTKKEINDHYQYVDTMYRDASKTLCERLIKEKNGDNDLRYIMDYIGLLFWRATNKNIPENQITAVNMINKIYATVESMDALHPIAARLFEEYKKFA
jgi:hypothetical protein